MFHKRMAGDMVCGADKGRTSAEDVGKVVKFSLAHGTEQEIIRIKSKALWTELVCLSSVLISDEDQNGGRSLNQDIFASLFVFLIHKRPKS